MTDSSGTFITRRSALAGSLALPTLFANAQTAAHVDEDWTDSARNRSLPVRLRWPTASSAQSLPVVIYSHGLGGSRAGGAVWGEAWAAAGFVVLHLQHPGSDTAVFRNIANLRAMELAKQLQARLEDVGFAIDEITRRSKTAGSPWARANLGQMGLGGHSFGAHTSLGMAGQRFATGQSVKEDRLRSFIGLSPRVPRREPSEALKSIARPMLSITGSLDGSVLGDDTTVQDRLAVYDNLPSGAKAELFLHDADHMTFGGGTGARGDARGEAANSALLRGVAVARKLDAQHQALVARISTDWWRKTLLGDAAAAQRLQAPSGLAAADRWRAELR